MIESLELKNFKSIKHKNFPLRNLNVLLGLNGQGKSSFIQSLLLLRQSDKISQGELTLNGGENGLVNIGTTKDALYQYSKSKELSITIQFKNALPYRLDFGYQIDADIFKQKNQPPKDIYEDELFNYFDFNKNQSLFSTNFQYLNAQRVEPKAANITSYSNVVDANSIGKYGQYTAHYIELKGNEDVMFDNILHKDSLTVDPITGKSFTNRTLINQINLWLGEISPGVNVRTTKITSDIVLLEYDFKQPNFGNTNRYKPENVGFGISYALHVVTALLSSRPGELLIIENPESHIHPKGQAQLGKLITLVANNDVQVIIETHSDHILNGIRVGVKEKPELKDKTILFHFEKIVTDSEQFSEITNIEIDKNGELSEYPKNLLEEWSNQLLKLL
jgi:predicted ATPase